MENDRKTQIIKTAAKRFARHGLNKTTLEEIAGDLRMGKSTIYHYFTSKEDLFYQTLESDAFFFIEEIKQIFNIEHLPLKERLLGYLNLKYDVYNKYKLLYDLMIRVLKNEGLEKEQVILKNLIQNEENVLKLVLNSFYSSRIDSMNPALPLFFVMQSWGNLFGRKLNEIRSDSLFEVSNDLLVTNLENIINRK